MLRLSLFLLPWMVFAAEEAEHGSSELTYKWINFAILAAAIGYLIVKFMLPALRTRASVIQQDLAESAATVKKAEDQVSQLTAKLNNFDAEIAEIRTRSVAEREAEAQRIAAQTEAMLGKVRAQQEYEISSYAQVGESQLRAYTIEKALELAQARLAAQTDPATQGALVNAFVADLARQEAR